MPRRRIQGTLTLYLQVVQPELRSLLMKLNCRSSCGAMVCEEQHNPPSALQQSADWLLANAPHLKDNVSVGTGAEDFELG